MVSGTLSSIFYQREDMKFRALFTCLIFYGFEKMLHRLAHQLKLMLLYIEHFNTSFKCFIWINIWSILKSLVFHHSLITQKSCEKGKIKYFTSSIFLLYNKIVVKSSFCLIKIFDELLNSNLSNPRNLESEALY